MDGGEGGWGPRGVDLGGFREGEGGWGEWECLGVLEEAGGVGGGFEWVGELVFLFFLSLLFWESWVVVVRECFFEIISF